MYIYICVTIPELITQQGFSSYCSSVFKPLRNGVTAKNFLQPCARFRQQKKIAMVN